MQQFPASIQLAQTKEATNRDAVGHCFPFKSLMDLILALQRPNEKTLWVIYMEQTVVGMKLKTCTSTALHHLLRGAAEGLTESIGPSFVTRWFYYWEKRHSRSPVPAGQAAINYVWRSWRHIVLKWIDCANSSYTALVCVCTLVVARCRAACVDRRGTLSGRWRCG